MKQRYKGFQFNQALVTYRYLLPIRTRCLEWQPSEYLECLHCMDLEWHRLTQNTKRVARKSYKYTNRSI